MEFTAIYAIIFIMLRKNRAYFIWAVLILYFSASIAAADRVLCIKPDGRADIEYLNAGWKCDCHYETKAQCCPADKQDAREDFHDHCRDILISGFSQMPQAGLTLQRSVISPGLPAPGTPAGHTWFKSNDSTDFTSSASAAYPLLFRLSWISRFLC